MPGETASRGTGRAATEFAAAAEQLAAAAERALADGGCSEIGAGDIARAMSAAVKVYAARAEAAEQEPPAPPVSADAVTPTEVVTAVSEMLRAVDVSLFDLAMWYRRPTVGLRREP